MDTHGQIPEIISLLIIALGSGETEPMGIF